MKSVFAGFIAAAVQFGTLWHLFPGAADWKYLAAVLVLSAAVMFERSITQ